MTMEEVIARINVLARKAKTQPLTPEEAAEQAALRRRYVEAVKANLTAQLDHTYLLRPDGTREKLKKREKK